jgi:GST-like protein
MSKAVMTRWRPGRQWFAENAPQLHSIATRTDAIPELQAVWSRNFPEAGS